MGKPYIASDYAGFDAGLYSFYFGYEQTMCKNHGPSCDADCENCEWAFVARKGGVEFMRLAQSDLGVGDGYEMPQYLLAGVQKFIAKHVT